MTGRELKELRRKLGLSVKGLALRIGWTARSGGREIRRMEAGTREVPATVQEWIIEELRGKRIRR